MFWCWGGGHRIARPRASRMSLRSGLDFNTDKLVLVKYPPNIDWPREAKVNAGKGRVPIGD